MTVSRSYFAHAVYRIAALAALPLMGFTLFLCVWGGGSAGRTDKDDLAHMAPTAARRVSALLERAALSLQNLAVLAENNLPPKALASALAGDADAEELLQVYADGPALRLGASSAARGNIPPGLSLRSISEPNAAYIAGYAVPPGGDAPRLYLARDVRLPQGKALSYVQGISLQRLREALYTPGLPSGATLLLLNAKGEVLASAPPLSARNDANAPVTAASLADTSAGLPFSTETGASFAAFAPLTPGADSRALAGGLSLAGMGVALHLDGTVSPALFLDEETALRFGLAAAALLLAGLGACLLYRSFCARPLAKLLRAARSFAEGDYSACAKTRLSVREFRSLAACLNTLARQLDAKNRSLHGATRVLDNISQDRVGVLANLSHEFRTPLNTIIGMAYLALRGKKLAPVQEGYVRRIHEAGGELQRIINGILEMSRIGKSAASVPNSLFTMHDIFAEQHRLFSPMAKKKGLFLSFEPADNVPPKLVGDPVRLARIIGRLLDNALRYTDRGGVTVSCEVLERRLSKATLRIAVQDTGPGMTPGQTAAFRRLFSGGPPVLPEKPEPGTRMGLLIAHRLALYMGARLSLRSAPGKGCRITLRMETGVRSQTPAPRGKNFLRGLRLLAVDDDPVSLTLLEEILTKYGAAVSTSTVPEKGLDLVRQADEAGRPFHCLLLDWRMPGLDGVSMAKRVRSDASLRAKPAIILISAYGWEGIPGQAQLSGADAFLHKPLSERMLLDALATLDGMENAPDSAEPGAPDTQSAARNKAARLLDGMRVLVVEDNILNQQIVRELLADVGIRALGAENGARALDMFEAPGARPEFDLVLMDLQMPEMDGFEATRRIRRLPQGRDLPIITMSAYTREQVVRQAFEAGMDDYVGKPFDTETLFAALARWRPPTPAPAGQKKSELVKLAAALGSGAPDALEQYEDQRDFLLAHMHQGRTGRLDALLDAGELGEAGAFLERLIGVLFPAGIDAGR